MAEPNITSAWMHRACPRCGELVWSVKYPDGEWQPSSGEHECRDLLAADRDRLAAENARLRAALWEMLSHYAPDPDDDTEAAMARAALGGQAAAE